MTLDFVNKSPNENPTFSDAGSSGFDLRAWITEEMEGFLNENKKYAYVLKPLERKLIHTGLYFNVPEHHEIQVRPRSGLAIKKGLTVINSPGTIDESYTGECCILVINLSIENIMIENGDRIAQGVLCPVYNGRDVCLNEVDDLKKESERGDGGFGHSGVK